MGYSARMGDERRNRLAGETSPYLLQHADNPVDWFPWGTEAFETARREKKPVLLSVGYSACHWCHVMEHESFEDEETARLMNEQFVNIKVDREERPDIDEIYMTCVQMMTGRGGWPMTVFLTPDGEPFYGGTYFPPEDRHGLPSFRRILLAVADAYRERPQDVRQTADKILATLHQLERNRSFETKSPSGSAGPASLDKGLLERAADALLAGVDSRYGGLGRAPKFPNTMVFSLFLRAFHLTGKRSFLDATTHTLRQMADGGIHDQLGGGFHRYSVDERWLVPHFEKMLYDNAQLARLYLDAGRASGEAYFLDVAEDILRYVTREMLAPEGGFYSTQDADSEGVEGQCFVWTRDEVSTILGEEAGEIFCRVYDVTDVGNFERRNILHVTLTTEQAARMFRKDAAAIERLLAESRRKLFAVREGRVKPFRDEKILAGWNGLMLSAYVDAYRATGHRAYLEVAERTAAWIDEHFWTADRLLHGYKDGESRVPAFLDDYAALGLASLDLFEVAFESIHLERAKRCARAILDFFWDPVEGGFFFTASDHEKLLTRTKPAYDGSVPSGNSMAAQLCLRLYSLTESREYLDKAESVLRLYQSAMIENPMAYANFLAALDFHLRKPREIVIVAPGAASGAAPLLAPLGRHYAPNQIVFCYDPAAPPAVVPPFAEGKPLLDSRPTAYVCHDFTCSPPVTEWPALRDRIEERR